MANKNQSRKLFTGPVQPKVMAGMGPQFATSLQKLDNVIGNINPNYKTMAAQAAVGYITDRMQSRNPGYDQYSPSNRSPNRNPQQPSKPSNQPGSGKGGSLVFQGNKSNPSNVSYALSKAPNPKEISLNSGVRPNTFVNDYMTPVTGSCSPLHMIGGAIQLPTSGTNPISSYIDNTVIFDIQTRAQSNVNFALDTTSAFSASNIHFALNAVVQALQTYFYYSSILSYESDPRNKNAGMIYLRSLITPQILSDVTQLGRRLEDTPCPPRIVEWARYMSGNFLSSNTQCAPIIKVFPVNSCIDGTYTGTSTAATSLAALTTTSNNTVFTLMRRAIPQWRIGTLYDCPTTPTYDPNFKTIFANKLNNYYTAGASTLTHTVADLYTSYPYNSYINKLDGMAFAMTSLYVSSVSNTIPNLFSTTTVNATYTDNRVSYYVTGGVPGFVNSSSDSFVALSRQETATNLSGVIYTPHLFGSAKCQNVTASALLQSAQNTIDFLFDVNSIPIKGAMKDFSGKVKSYI